MNTRELTMAEAINEAIRHEMRRNPEIILLGQDIGTYGGTFGVYKGLVDARTGAARDHSVERDRRERADAHRDSRRESDRVHRARAPLRGQGAGGGDG